MEPSALLDASLSSYTNFYSVYVYTFTYCIGENCNKFLFFSGISFRRANSLLFSYSSYSIDLFMNVVPTTLSCHFCSLKFLFHPDKIITRENLKQVTQPMTRPVHVPYASTQQSINYRT